MSDEDFDKAWNRRCKTENCHGLARADSDYCVACRKERKIKGLGVKRCGKD